MRVDVESGRTHVLPVPVSKAAPAAGERQSQCFAKSHSRSCAAVIFAIDSCAGAQPCLAALTKTSFLAKDRAPPVLDGHDDILPRARPTWLGAVPEHRPSIR